MNNWNYDNDNDGWHKSELIAGGIFLVAIVVIIVVLAVASINQKPTYRGVDPGGANYLGDHDSYGPGTGGTWIGN